MAEIKYKHAYNENGNLVCIESISKEDCKSHNYICVGCGNPLLPRAIGSKYRRAHFYHKEEVVCSGETYLHKLAKRVIKNKFETESAFYVEYEVLRECNDTECVYRNPRCTEERFQHRVDLRKYYDTCTEETPINGYVADLLLTNSKNPELEPTLIEVCVSHPCDENKKESGLRIIEIKIKNEQDIFFLKKNDVFRELLYAIKKERKIYLYSFKRELRVPLQVKIQRYVFCPNHNSFGKLTEINCNHAHYRVQTNSLLELNIVNKQDRWQWNLSDVLQWMSTHKGLRRCNLCKFYYATMYEDHAICRLSKKYGKPANPEMNEAERCSSYRNDNRFFEQLDPNVVIIEEVNTLSYEMKPQYRVILAVSRTFNNYGLYKEKVLHYLSDKMKTHTVVIITGVSRSSDIFTDKLLDEIYFIKEHHKANWEKYGEQTILVSNDEMTNSANALIAFWDGRSKGVKNLIDNAKQKGIKVAVVEFNPDFNQ